MLIACAIAEANTSMLNMQCVLAMMHTVWHYEVLLEHVHQMTKTAHY